MTNLVPIVPHDRVIPVPLDQPDLALFQALVSRDGVTDPRRVFWDAWERCAREEFGKVQYRRFSLPVVPKHTTHATDGQALPGASPPVVVRWQARHFMDLMLVGMVLGRRGERDPAVLLRQLLRSQATAVLGKVRVRAILDSG